MEAAMAEVASPRRPSSSVDPAHTPSQSRSPILLSEAWKQLHLASPSQLLATPSRALSSSTIHPGQSKQQQNEDDADSSDDGFLSDHSEQLHPETGFDPFLAATRRARQHSSSSLLLPQTASAAVSPASNPSTSGSSPATSSDNVASTSPPLDQQEQRRQAESYRWSRIAKFWSKVVDEAMFHEKKQPKQGLIDLSSKNITDILPTIADLSRFVALPPPRYDPDQDAEILFSPGPQHLIQSKTGGLVRHESYLAPFSAHIHNDAASAKTSLTAKRTLSRSQSAFQPSLGRPQSFARTNSAMSTLSSPSAGSYRDHRDRQATLSIFLGSNSLTRLPSAFFQLQNLRVLSLRSNKLKFLPPAIGDLHNLSELHVPNNELQYLPAEILRLKLDVFTWFPNPYLLKPPKAGVLTLRPLFCHRAKRIRQQHSLNKLAELDEVDEAHDASFTTPIRNDAASTDGVVNAIPLSQQPPPLIRAPAPSSSRQPRHMDRTRSEMQVEGFLARGIDRLGMDLFASISERDAADTTLDPDDTASQLAIGAEAVDDAELERQRILEAAFEEADGADAFDLTPSTKQSTFARSKVAGRSRVLGGKQVSGLPTLQELCIRKLLSPYDIAEDVSQGIVSPFLSPVVQTSGGPQRRLGSSSRSSSRQGTSLLFEAQRNCATSFGSNASCTRSFNSNRGPEDSRFGKRLPTLLQAYENGTLQSLVGELGHGLVPILEAARRSATQDWGTRARMRSSSSATAKRSSFARTQSVVDALSTAEKLDESGAHASTTPSQPQEEEEACDVFGGVDVPGSLDRGDDACSNPWFSRCPNPKHCEERSRESRSGHGLKRTADIALHRGKRGLGSTSSVSSFGTTLGGGKVERGSVDMERAPSTAASSDSGVAPASPLSSSASSSVGTVGVFARSTWTSWMPCRPESQVGGGLPLGGQQVRLTSNNAQRSLASSGLGRTWSSSRPAFGRDGGMTRPASTQFVRGFSTSSALSASGLNRSTSFGPGNTEEAERDWPLTELEHRQAPVFSTAGETRLEWISHIGGIRVAKLGEAQVDLDDVDAPASNGADAGEGTQPSLLGAMGGFENKDLLPILWRGCSRGCLDFLV
ncbi:hypothetical protein NDA11_001952 [Ustilago hordei]|uniref:Uncharacterized protein n=1 Tax=Ustilago hordei TaxID=120017 RepID=I2FMS2_USTHO|nr:uncharacterized protein UHO2_04821 [Ustilago hordei]KAJ1041877.1 hypothetical protein NDA10_006207 [Ustilago hordei]KAJ1575478.1 hypothetical protein NDA15_003504 [Ustilago hordei]KAJ1577155.1 hypothetical protein NDA12_000783 [Ustilago hordei]KAJ1595102.1 hypothetical protein NDA11_001952 [Ustilago hordei]KAJ1597066.1 hypothetical protein NDA14_004626 [Ustilago hordei]